MANNIIKRVWNQGSMTPIEDLQGSAFTNENGGHTFQISGVDSNGEALALSGTVAASFLRPDQTSVGITGSVSGGVASVTLSAECYGIPGRFGLVIFLTSDGKKTAIYSCVGNVARSSTDAVAPGVAADVVDLINEIETAVGTIPASYSALMADIAPTYSSTALYAVGDYAWYEGDLKRCIVPITVGETYTPAHWTSAVVGDDVSALKSAINGYSKYNAHNIVFPVTNHTSKYNTVFTKTGVNTVYVDTSNLNPNNRNPDYYYVYLDSTNMPVELGKSYILTVNSTDNSNLTLQVFVKDSSDNRTILYSGGSTSNYKITIPSDAYSFTLRYLAQKAVGTGTIGFTLFDEAELSPKRAETQKLIFDELGIIDTEFVVGVATNSGTINTSPKYANATKQIVSIPFDANLKAENGYQFFLQLFNDDGTFNKTTSWVLNELYHIEANQKFMLTIALSPLNSSYVSSENEFKTCVRFERTNRQWIGKNWYAFGTSISDTTFPMPYDLPGYTGKYPPYLAQLSGLIHSNYALGGSRITNSATADRDTILEKILETDLSDADLITIDGFVNDFGACEIGDLESLTPETADDTTLYGAMFLAITHCLENSNAVVCLLTDNTGKIWITPQGQTHPTDLRPWKKDGHGKTQNDYQDAMRKIAKYLGCYCIDAGSMSSINYCHPEYLQDTIHQSVAGGKQYANAIWSVLKNIQPNVPRT